MRIAVLIVSVSVLAASGCGGSVAPIPSPEPASRPGSEATASGGAPVDPTPPVSTPPTQSSVVATPACDTSGPERSFASADELARALMNAWDACSTNPICPASEPHLYFGYDPGTTAACSHWCSGDGGPCPTSDPTYRFTYAVTPSTSGGYVLALTGPTSARSFRVRWWASEPFASMTLTDVTSHEVTALQVVGIPVK